MVYSEERDDLVIIVRLTGGLGNQMFQYAAARSLADRFSVPLRLDISDFESYFLRRYEIHDFAIRATIADDKELAPFRVKKNRLTLWQRILRKTSLNRHKSLLAERSFAYDERIEIVRPPVYLDGYWQSERYFSKNSDAIRSDFSLAKDLDNANAAIKNQINSVCAVSVHVRRGDYVSDQRTNHYHGTCGVDYYNGAIKFIKQRVEHPHFFVFSDDHDWTKKNIACDAPTTYVTANSSKSGILDMALMRQCRHHIIANSSFSWWGAWLNPLPDKIVIAPQRWFSHARHDTSDLIPGSWLKV